MRELRARQAGTALLAGLMLAGLLGVGAGATPAAAAEEETATATFEGETVPMDEVWEEAAACVMWPDESIDCYRTTEEREEAERSRSTSSDTEGFGIASTSSTCPVRLYALTSYGGTELTLTTRWKWHNLSTYGFNNRTSSYRIYECSATFRDGSYGSGSTYSGITSAWTWSSSMAYGWNNRVSSVWIH